jgi:RNA polymerase sigma-70 factor (ECF subfamily)
VEAERGRLLNVAYRLLGSLTEAEDAVQEAYARWFALPVRQREAVVSPGAWLNRVTGRVCLNVLGSARMRRERYVGAWLPEPLPGAGAGVGVGAGGDGLDPADRITLDESVDMALLVVLETMTPAERVAFVLHDVFRYPFAEVAAIVDRTPAACRQLAVSARRRVAATRPRTSKATTATSATSATSATRAQQASAVREFKKALEAGDVRALIGLLDPEVSATGDGGGLAATAGQPVTGAARLAHGLVGLTAPGRPAAGLTYEERPVNGRPGLVALDGGGTVVTVYAFGLGGDGRITEVWAVRNPRKLGPWRRTV